MTEIKEDARNALLAVGAGRDRDLPGDPQEIPTPEEYSQSRRRGKFIGATRTFFIALLPGVLVYLAVLLGLPLSADLGSGATIFAILWAIVVIVIRLDSAVFDQAVQGMQRLNFPGGGGKD